MPASSADNLQLLEDAVKASLSCESGDLDQKLLASSKRALFERIKFRQARYKYKLITDNLRSKYIQLSLLNATQHQQPLKSTVGGNEVIKGVDMNDDKSDGIPSPKIVFYPPDKLKLEWQQVQHIGAGLQNLGNTCFLNSTLQCLTYTAPLVNYLLSEEHTNKCKLAGFCMLCELQRHIRRALYKGGEAIKPQCMLQKLKAIAKHMHWGRQEDAHEFLRYVIDAMHNSCLNGYIKKQLDPSSLETTIVNRIFGGYHRSQVQCLRCKETSNTYDPFMDISLDIKNVSSLEKALDRFVQPETLENDNAYLCPRCKIKVPALKRFSIHRAPNIATFQLKRFDYNRFHGGKIVKHITFPERLDLRPYMSQRQGSPVNYSLYAVLVHQGPTCNSGHYFCFVRNSNNMWYLMDDSRVRQVSTSFVLSQQAYLLFYARILPTVNNVNTKVNSVTSKNLLCKVLAPEAKANGAILNATEVLSLSTPKKLTTPVEAFHRAKLEETSGAFLSNPVKTENGPSHPLPVNRDRISFDVKSLQDRDKPRIVMHIKHGKVYNSIQQPSIFNQMNTDIKTETKPMRKELVPYGRGEDSDSSDQENKSSLSNVTAKNQRTSPEKLISSPSKLSVKAAENQFLENCKTPEHNSWNKKVSVGLMSPQSKRTNDSLILTLPTNCVKVKATSSWQITDPSPVSPSLGSNSSNASVNSTTDWTVLDKNGTPHVPLLPERQYPGWKITPIEDRNSSKCFESCEEKNNDSINERLQVNNEGSSNTAHKNTDLSKDIKKNIAQYEKASERDIGHFILKRTKVDSDSLESGLPHTSESSKPKEMFQVHLKTFSSPLTIDVCKDNPHECEKDSQEWSTSSKHDDSGKYWEDRRKSEHSKSSRENWDSKDECRISRESDLYSEKFYLINGHKSEGSVYSSKKHKKHKKKKHRSSSPKSRSDSLEINSSTKHKKKKHKHKKDKDRHLDKERKHKRYNDSSYERSDKNLESSSESSFELEWVEKTKETVEQEKQGDQQTVPTITWDHYVKENREPPKPAAAIAWDGTNSSGIVNELVKHSGKAYGSAVSSWDGEANTLDQESELKNDLKRHHSDDYNEEYDKGKVKKVKVYKPKSESLDYNPFQKIQNQRNDQNFLKFSYGQDC